MKRLVWPALLAVGMIGVLLLFVLPGRNLLQQQRSIHHAENRIALLDQENARLSGRIALLQTNAEIEQIARQEFGLVMPGQRSYVILPGAAPDASATPTTTTVP